MVCCAERAGVSQLSIQDNSGSSHALAYWDLPELSFDEALHRGPSNLSILERQRRRVFAELSQCCSATAHVG